MMTVVLRRLPLLCWVLVVVWVLVTNTMHAEPANQTTPEKIADLVRQLGHDKFGEREEASERLLAIGAPALEALRAAAKNHADLEVRGRATDVLRGLAAREEADAAKKDLKLLQGTWYTISIHHHGNVLGPNVGDTHTIDGDRYIQKMNGEVYGAGQIRIVKAQADVKQIEFIVMEGIDTGAHYYSIYRLDGDDLAFCSDDGRSPGDTRPKSFSGDAGYLRTMKRVK